MDSDDPRADSAADDSEDDQIVTVKSRKKRAIIRDDSSDDDDSGNIDKNARNESEPLSPSKTQSAPLPTSPVINCKSDSDSDSDAEAQKSENKSRENGDSENESTGTASPKTRKIFSDDDGSNEPMKSKSKIDRSLMESDSDSEKITSESEREGDGSQRVKNKKKSLADKFDKRFSKSKKAERVRVMNSKISALCDEDSSEDEIPSDNFPEYQETPTVFHVAKPKKSPKKTERPQRMSAKEAMQQMQKIKSESGRMLREKEVYLPYHQPKKFTLAEVLNRKKISLTVGEKKPSFKMNEEELIKFSREIDEKVKTMIELCKSESEEEEEEENKTEEPIAEIPKDEKSENDINEDEEKSDNILQTNDISGELKNDVESSENITEIPHSELMENNMDDKIDSVENTDDSRMISDKTSEIIDEINIDNQNENLNTMETEPIGHLEFKLTEEIVKETENDVDSGILIENSENDQTAEDIETTKENKPDVEMQPISEHTNVPFSQIIQASLSILTPKLTGSPGTLIDLDSGDVKLTGVELLKQKYIFHSSMKTPEEKEREREKRIQPGALLSKLKQELEDQISEQRAQEWAKRMEEERLKREEEKALNGNLSDCEEALIDETEKLNKKEENDEKAHPESEESGESEPEENDVIIKDKPKSKCDYLDEEAEEDEDEEGVADDVQNEENEEDEEESESESDSDEDEVESTVTEVPKRPSRILKAFEDSDEEKENMESEKTNQGLSTPTSASKTFKFTQSKELFNSEDYRNLEWDMALGQNESNNLKTPGNSETKHNSTLADIISPLEKMSTTKVQLSENFPSTSPNVFSSSKANVPTNNKLQNLQKKLFCDSEAFATQNTQEILDLCSGNFPVGTDEVDSELKTAEKLFDNMKDKYCEEMTQNTENELLGLCTGKFDIPEQNNTSTDSQQIVLSLSNTEDPNTEVLIGDSEEKSVSKSSIHSFFKPVEKPEIEKRLELPSSVLSKRGGQFVIVSSEDEIDDTGDPQSKRKILKSKKDRNKKKRQALQISDDETEDEEEDEVAAEELELNDEEVDDNGERIVDYDSEENEIEVQTQIVEKVKKKKTSDFFENEAELTSEDEWKGSGDEDERGLDMFEAEAGDADQLDQNAVRKELEKIHMRQILDQDKREVRILQEMLLEDGDLEGGTRERKFRWKNIDATIENGAILDDDGDIMSLEDAQSEEQWRKQRHEREVYLRQLMEQEMSSQEETSIISSTLVMKTNSSSIKRSIDTVDSQQNDEEVEGAKKKANVKDLPSPAKKPFLLMQSNVRGSFLSRGPAALNRLALLTKNGPAVNENNPSKINAGQKGNFVFATISPPCKEKFDSEDIKLAKRKAHAEINTTPLLIKKMRVTETTTTRLKGSLLDHID